VRRIARQLRPEALDDLGLASALRVFGERLGDQSPVELDMRLSEPRPPLAPEQELVIYRVAQEALTNVLRHAGASRALLSPHGARRRRGAARGRRRARPRAVRRRAAASAACASAAVLVGAELDVGARPAAARRSCSRCRWRACRDGPIRVLLADDHAVVRRGLRLVLESEPDLRVVAEAATAPMRCGWGSSPTSTSRCSTSRCRA
jgi:hypothetical protein